MLFIKISTIILFCSYCFACKKYHNYSLLSATPRNDRELRFLKHLDEKYNVSYWRQPTVLNKPVDFIVSIEEKKNLLQAAEEHGIYVGINIEDVQKVLDNQMVSNYLRRSTGTFDWNSYFTLDDIYNWLSDLANDYPSDIKLISIGKSHQNADIFAVQISLRGADLMRPKVFIEGGIHAREWISPAFVTYLINEILHSPDSENSVLKEVAMKYEWYIVPILNPDGYKYTHTRDRLWRKNRRPSGGVDLNRNFGYGFGTLDCWTNQYSQTYCGKHSFSEPESRALSEYVRSNSENLKYYFSIHSYGQFMIIPYGNTKKHLENYAEVKTLTKLAAEKIAIRYKTKYTYGTSYDTVGYMAGGLSTCWVKNTFNIPYAITFELRDRGWYGFALPSNQILPTCLETMDGLLAILDAPSSSHSINGSYGGNEKLHHYNRQGSKSVDIRLFCGAVFVFVALY